MKRLLFIALIFPFATFAGTKHKAPKKPVPAPVATPQPLPNPENPFGPPPKATLTIVGQAGVNQDDEVTACWYDQGAFHQLIAESGTCQTLHLNKAKEVQAGFYLLNFSDSLMTIQLAANEQKTVSLAKLPIPKLSGAKTFQAFRDYTNPDEQEKLAVSVWGVKRTQEMLDVSRFHGPSWVEILWESSCKDHKDKPEDKTCVFVKFTEAQLCSGISSKVGKAGCAALTGDDYKKLVGTVIDFGSDGSWNSLSIGYTVDFNHHPAKLGENLENTGWSNRGMDFINSKASVDWGWISVFPGTYGIRYADDVGATQDVLGQVANY